ncbi:MAG: hypothetical protein HQL32_07675, partial [Planctomycetes bacterium]|nr:hypothetical protein [Planctomycetota bacterium]
IIESYCKSSAYSVRPLEISFEEEYVQFKTGDDLLGVESTMSQFKVQVFDTDDMVLAFGCSA